NIINYSNITLIHIPTRITKITLYLLISYIRRNKMKFTIRRQPLLVSIQEVNHAISPRTAVVPILTGMKLTLDQNILTLTGSNSDITIESTIPSTIEDEEIITNMENGSIVLPIPHFSDIIRKLPGDYVQIE